MNKRFQIGLTGGIGSGKTVVSKMFNVLGIPVYDSDFNAKELMTTDPELIQEIKFAFGNEVYEMDGLNRDKLAAKVFNNPAELEKLNRMVHPRVGKHYLNWVSKQTSPVVIKEAALLFESNIARQLDFIIVVTAPETLRIERVKDRDKRTVLQIREIMANQWPQEETIERADAVIVNDNQRAVIPQVMAIWDTIKRKASLN